MNQPTNLNGTSAPSSGAAIARTAAPARASRELTPKAIVEELDRYIVGQTAAKRAVAIALRNRWRRQQAPEALREEITPKNIIMIGPTGVGKTEIARRLARLASAPFVKLEASKFTEVGYVGRDVDAIVRDLAEVSVKLVREEEQAKVQRLAAEAAETRLLSALVPPPARAQVRELLRAGRLHDREVEIDLLDQTSPTVQVFGGAGIEQMGFDISQLQRAMGAAERRKRRKVRVSEALALLTQEEAERLIDMEKVRREAVDRAEQSGIVFLDEIDKIAGPGSHAGPDVSREGVQRDLLPVIEGSTVSTKYGQVRTDHVLFIAAGAFHVSKPSDLIPELQGRFPIRVELDPLSRDDLVRVLIEPESSLIRQYEALLLTEGVRIVWQRDAIEEVARLAGIANQRMEDIGARRLQTIVERVLDELSFDAPEVGRAGERLVTITPQYVRDRVSTILEDQDLSQYIL